MSCSSLRPQKPVTIHMLHGFIERIPQSKSLLMWGLTWEVKAGSWCLPKRCGARLCILGGGGLLNKYSFTDLLSMSMDYDLLCFLKHIFTLIFFLTSGYQVTFSLIWGRKLIFAYPAPAFFSKFSRRKRSLEMSEEYQWIKKSPDCQRRAWHGHGKCCASRAGLPNRLPPPKKFLTHLALSVLLWDMTTCKDFDRVHFLLATFNLLTLYPFSSWILWLSLWSQTLDSGCLCLDDVWSAFCGWVASIFHHRLVCAGPVTISPQSWVRCAPLVCPHSPSPLARLSSEEGLGALWYLPLHVSSNLLHSFLCREIWGPTMDLCKCLQLSFLPPTM